MKVAILDHTALLGGAELALARMLEALPADAPEVLVVLFGDGPLAERLRAIGIDVRILPLDERVAGRNRHDAGGALTAARSSVAVLPFVRRLVGLLRDQGVHVVYTTSLKADLIGMVAARLMRRPLVWHIHDRISVDYLPRPVVDVLRYIARHAPAVVIANSRATAATLPGARNLRIAWPGLAPEQFAPAGERDGRALDTPIIGMLGRISPTKGQLQAVRALAQVREKHPGATLRIVGSPMFGADEYAADVRAEVSRLGLDDAVIFVGFSDNIAAEMQRMTVCVHASPVPEPFGQVIAEAMAQGVPVVATDAGGAPEILDDPQVAGPLGWLVPPGDVGALARAITEVIDHPDEARERARRAHASVRRRLPISSTSAIVVGAWFDAYTYGNQRGK